MEEKKEPKPMRLMHAYRILKCYSDRDITGKDCSRLRLDDAIKRVLPEIKKMAQKECDDAMMSIEEFKGHIKSLK